MENPIAKVGQGSTLSLRAQQSNRDWVAGRIATLLSHYWRDDDPVELITASADDWVEILSGMPQQALQDACLKYLRDEPRRRPTPGAILALARAAMPRPTIVPPVPEAKPPRVTKEQADEILRAANFRPRKFSGDAE